ncbi:LuxR C-terminal-related transcriptional regulator [Halomonadaceae bacterium KBTZ08]
MATKFMRPAADPRAIARPRLLERLQPDAARRVTTITAPAGYGKTTLVNQWCANHDEAVGWLSLDEQDDEPRRFWSYILGSLEHTIIGHQESIHRYLDSPGQEHIEGALTALINALTELSIPHTNLILDDYHLIQDADIQRQMTFLVDHAPPALHLVLLSRTEPPLPLSRWRVKGWMEGLHASDLAFSETECSAFFNHYMGLALDADRVRAIWQRTEGWAAAMQLTALSGKSTSTSDLTQAVLNEGEHSRQINDYILTEILDQQTPEVRDFLLRTSVCRRLSAELCNSVLERDDSQAVLEQLVHANLFIIPLDTRDQWFRYHDLFREALAQRLSQTDPEAYRALQARAIRWLLEEDHLQEAIVQLLQLEDWDWLEQVLEQYGNNLIHTGFHELVHKWLQYLPDERTTRNPRLMMLQIWALFFLNRLSNIEPLLEQLEDILDIRVANSDDNADVALALHNEIALIRSYMARTRSDHSSAQHLTQQVLRDIDHTNIPLKSVTYYGIGLDCYANGDLASATHALESAVAYGRREKKHATTLSSGGLLAWILFYQGEMDRALDVGTGVREWVNSYHTDPQQPRLVSCWQNSAMVQIHREKNDLTLADAYMTPLLPHLGSGSEPGQHVVIQYTRAHLAFSRGQYQAAMEYLEDAERVQDQKRDAILFEPPCLEALHIRCHLALGDDPSAQAWKERLENHNYRNPINREQAQIGLARLLLAEGQAEAAINLLAPLRLSTEKGRHIKHLIELLAVYALCLDQLGQGEQAGIMLHRALELASRERFLRLFVEEGPALAALYRRIPRHGLPTAFLRELDSLLAVEPESATTPPSASYDGTEELVEPLSQREIEVLALIHAGHANKEIARRMSVAQTTVKAHIRNLYGKLGASSRTGALARARELGLVD